MGAMKELEYPFDPGYIIGRKKKLKKQLLASEQGFTDKKIAVLGGSTTAEIKNILEIFLLNQGIRPSFYESEYNRYYEDAVFENPALRKFGPDIVYIHTTNRNITAYPGLQDDREKIDSLLSGEFRKFQNIWDSLAEKYHCTIIQNNFEMPAYRLMGNRDVSDIHGAGNFLSRLNMKFYEYAQTHENFYICDINYISADYGLKEWADPFYFHLYKYALSVQAIPFLAFNVANMIKSVYGKNKKGLVLDLDNTLWGGVIGDEGPEKIKLGPEEPGGQVYSEFQRYLKAHMQLGTVLAVDSKNDYENAVAGLRHPDSQLQPEDFAVLKANWESKDRNFKAIAEELNLLPESLVFVDDNPAERHMVREQCPGVSVPEIGESHQYIQHIDRNGYFEVTLLSKEDMARGAMYRENAERVRLQGTFADYGEYLRSLEMKAEIQAFQPMYLSRIAQLTNKSNQFNLTTKRYTQPQMEELAGNKEYLTLSGRLSDRFGDNGVVSVVIGHLVQGVCHIELWLMSCRVLKRDMEYAMMDALVQNCREKQVREIRGYYYPTAKNGMVREFYKTMGFEMISEKDGVTEWIYRIEASYVPKNRYIRIENNPAIR